MVYRVWTDEDKIQDFPPFYFDWMTLFGWKNCATGLLDWPAKIELIKTIVLCWQLRFDCTIRFWQVWFIDSISLEISL